MKRILIVFVIVSCFVGLLLANQSISSSKRNTRTKSDVSAKIKGQPETKSRLNVTQENQRLTPQKKESLKSLKSKIDLVRNAKRSLRATACTCAATCTPCYDNTDGDVNICDTGCTEACCDVVSGDFIFPYYEDFNEYEAIEDVIGWTIAGALYLPDCYCDETCVACDTNADDDEYICDTGCTEECCEDLDGEIADIYFWDDLGYRGTPSWVVNLWEYTDSSTSIISPVIGETGVNEGADGMVLGFDYQVIDYIMLYYGMFWPTPLLDSSVDILVNDVVVHTLTGNFTTESFTRVKIPLGNKIDAKTAQVKFQFTYDDPSGWEDFLIMIDNFFIGDPDDYPLPATDFTAPYFEHFDVAWDPEEIFWSTAGGLAMIDPWGYMGFEETNNIELNIWEDKPEGTIDSPYIDGIDDTMSLVFFYRVCNYAWLVEDYTAASADDFKVLFQVSENAGEFKTIKTIGKGTHTESAEFAEVKIDLDDVTEVTFDPTKLYQFRFSFEILSDDPDTDIVLAVDHFIIDDLDEWGHLNGKVTGGSDAALIGAKVGFEVAYWDPFFEEDLYIDRVATTNATGDYKIQYIPPDEYELFARMHGYVDYEDDITIAKSTLTKDIAMTELPKVKVTGTVLIVDTTTPIPGAFVTLSGFENYSTTTGDDGTFTINGVYGSNSYSMTVSKNGYVAQTKNITVAAVDLNAGTIYLEVSDSIFEEGFEGATFPPAGWTVIDNDDDGFNWDRVTNIDIEEDIAHGGIGMAYSESYSNYYEVELTPDNFLITPKISIPAGLEGVTLKWFVMGLDPDWSKEKYSVMLSTTTPTVAAFTKTLFSETLPNGTEDWLERTTSLDEYIGQEVYIAFRHHGVTDMFILVLDDISIYAGSTSTDDETISNITTLSGNYPNPFNPTTTISFNIPKNGNVKIEVYNVKGQKVKTLVNDSLEAGPHNVIWNGTDNSEKSVSSGIYFYKMESEGFTATKKMLLMK